MEQLWDTGHLSPIEQAAHLARLRSSIRAAYEVLGANLQAATAAAVSSDLLGTAKALGVPPAVAIRMATDPNTPDVALIRRGLMIVRRRPGLSVDAIIKAREAMKIDGTSDDDIRRMAQLLIEVADEAPLDGDTWTGAKTGEKTTFHQAVTYARSLARDT